MTEQEQNEKYEELVTKATEYASDKATESELKKRLEKNNASIKSLMLELGQDSVETTNGKTICYGVTTRESLDEERAIIQLHKYAPNTSCIETKEVINMDKLESEIYHGELSAEALSALEGCKVTKETPTITIKKTKKKEDIKED